MTADDIAAALYGCLSRVALRQADRTGSSGDQARRAHQFLRHRLARRPAWRPAGLVACIDNLVKGAAGQAIQNFNVAFGFEETLGLN